MDNIPHALLLSGPRGAPLAQEAIDFAIKLTGKHPHPDIHEYFPEGKTEMHPISTIRSLTSDVNLVPYSAPWKVFIIHDAERMLPTSSNALLKTLEEPSAHTCILLLSHHPEKLLPTILSRTQKRQIPAPPKTYTHPILRVLARQEPLSSLEEEDNIDELLETISLWYRDRLVLALKEGELTFPDYKQEIAATPFIPLDQVEKALADVRLAHARSMKLSTALEALFTQLDL